MSARFTRVLLIVLAPVLLRVFLTGFVDEIDADGYSRVLIAERMVESFRSGAFNWGLLYVPAWMPAWHLVCAAAQFVVPEPYYVPKLLSALFGGLSPALVFLITRHLSPRERTAWIAWAIAAVLPLHLFYSATAMSEPFSGFWVLLAVLALLRSRPGNQWLVVAAAAMLPVALTRYEAWFLLPVFPLVAIFQRRAEGLTIVVATAVLALGPLAWFVISAGAAGSPLAFLGPNAGYLRHLFEFDSAAANRGPMGWIRHVATIGAASSFTVTVLGVWGIVRNRTRDAQAVGSILGTHFAAMLVLWIFHLQVGYGRHYMVGGMLLAAAASTALERMVRRRLAAVVLVAELVVLLGIHGRLATWPTGWREAATFLADKPGGIYCDEPGVRVLSRLPQSRFVTGNQLPDTLEAAMGFLRASGVRWVVYAHVDYSPLPRLFPNLADAESTPPFRLALAPQTDHPFHATVLLYELDPGR